SDVCSSDLSGFTTERTNPQWIYKAEKGGIPIDLVFWLKGGITVDDEMLSRAVHDELAGRPVRVIPPEDLFVIKAISFDEQSNRHWYDALGLLAVRPLDWPYLVVRARHGARRVLSLLVFAQADPDVLGTGGGCRARDGDDDLGQIEHRPRLLDVRRRSGRTGGLGGLPVGEHRSTHEHDVARGQALEDRPRRDESVHHRHRDVHRDDVRLQRRRASHGLLAVGCVADDLEAL